MAYPNLMALSVREELTRVVDDFAVLTDVAPSRFRSFPYADAAAIEFSPAGSEAATSRIRPNISSTSALLMSPSICAAAQYHSR